MEDGGGGGGIVNECAIGLSFAAFSCSSLVFVGRHSYQRTKIEKNPKNNSSVTRAFHESELQSSRELGTVKTGYK